MSILKVENLTISFGGLMAVSDVNFEIEENNLVGLIGPNGAGKTTLFNLLTGVYTPTSGDIFIEGKSIKGVKPYNFAKLKIARTFQNIRLFKTLTVLENVMVAIDRIDTRYNLFDTFFRTKKYYTSEEKKKQIALDLLKVINLDDKANVLACNLPYGEQRKLEIVRALALEPKILFLDEPAAGMNSQETLELSHLIKNIKEKFNLTVILIEHDMPLVMSICEKILVLDYGRLIASGTALDIQSNKDVIKAYLGE